jgi:hypothetical protein
MIGHPYTAQEQSEGIQDDMAEWVKREYGKGEIDRAGAYLVSWRISDETTVPPEIGKTYPIVQNWRTSHGLPLNVFQAALRARTKRLRRPPLIVAQRLKRFSLSGHFKTGQWWSPQNRPMENAARTTFVIPRSASVRQGVSG